MYIFFNSSWLISRSFNAWDINGSMLLSLLLAITRILSWLFFFFLVIFNNFLIIPVDIEKIKVKHALAIPAKHSTDIPLLVTLKIIKILFM